MLSIALIAFLPRVEDPIPDTIGVGVIFSAAGAGGVVMLVLGPMVGLSDAELDHWARRGVSLGVCGRRALLRGGAGGAGTMKTMHRTSTLGLTIGSVVTAVGAATLTALTQTGVGGAYAFLFAGILVFSLFLIWPERSRPARDVRRSRTGREPK